MVSKLVLASSSPRREELLNRLGLNFTIVPSKIDENQFTSLPPGERVVELARAKAEEVVELVEDTIVIAADTAVVYNNKLLGKPADRKNAREMLRELQGDKHTVLTGLAVISTLDGDSFLKCDRAEVYMRRLDEEEITSYVNTGEPLDKAGSYGIQGLGGILIEKINGSYFTVVGLPLHKLAVILKKFSINVI